LRPLFVLAPKRFGAPSTFLARRLGIRMRR
jgi:hypothetical protein